MAIALVALVVAMRANHISNRQPFVAQQLGEMIALMAAAREVKKLYEGLFEPFQNAAAKIAARTRFLQAQEEVTTRVDDLAAAFEELDHLVQLWEDVVDAEDSHAANDAHTFTGARKVIDQKGIKVTEFVTATGTCVRKLRQQR